MTPKRFKRSYTALRTTKLHIEIDDQDLESLDAIIADYCKMDGNVPSHDRQEIINAVQSTGNYMQHMKLESRRVVSCTFEFVAHPAVCQFDALTELKITSLRGELPPGIGQLLNLQDLFISSGQDNGLTVLPPELGNLRKLTRLVLQCDLLESLCEELGHLVELERLDLVKCRALTKLPTTIGQLTKLKFMGIPSMAVSREFPTEIGKLSALEWLWLGDDEGPIQSMEILKTRPSASDSGTSNPVSEVANLVNLEHFLTKLSPLLFFPENFFANTRKSFVLHLQLDFNDYSWIDNSHFNKLPPSLERLSIKSTGLTRYLPLEDLEERYGVRTDNGIVSDDDIWLERAPRVRFPHQIWAWQHPLRSLSLDGSGTAGYPLSFSMMENLSQLEYLSLTLCNFEQSRTTTVTFLPKLQTMSLQDIKGTVDFEGLNLPSLEKFTLVRYSSHKRKVTVRLAGCLPALTDFSIWSESSNDETPSKTPRINPWTEPNDKLVIFEYDATVQLPVLHELLLSQCFVFGNASMPAPNEALLLPNLKVLRLRHCCGIFSSPSNFHLSLWDTPHLRRVEFLSYWSQGIPGWQQLDKLSQELLSRCPKLDYLNISRMKKGYIQNIPKATVSSLPLSIRRLRLSRSQLVDIVAEEENALELLGRCQQLGCFGEDYLSEEVVQAVSKSAACQKIGHMLSLNRARFRLLLLCGPVTASLYPLILEHAPRAFERYDEPNKEDDCPEIMGWFGVQKHPDAILHLLRERFLPEIFHWERC